MPTPKPPWRIERCRAPWEFAEGRDLGGEARVVGLAQTLEPFALDFTVWSRQNGCAAADIVPGSGRTVWGVLYRIPAHLIERHTAGDRRSLDAIESEGSNYVRVPIDLRLADGGRVEGAAITYVVRQRSEGLVTSFEYARHILEGLREHDAPADYLEYVKQRVIGNNAALEAEIAQRQMVRSLSPSSVPMSATCSSSPSWTRRSGSSRRPRTPSTASVASTREKVETSKRRNVETSK